MAKENTHLWFADRVLEKMGESELKKLIGENIGYYHLGSIFPDIFLYERNEKLEKVSYGLHIRKEEVLNNVLSMFAEINREVGTEINIDIERERAFATGFLTHCVLDNITHPTIDKMAGGIGYDYVNDTKKLAEIVYNHAGVEAYLDQKFNKAKFVETKINAEIIKNLARLPLIMKFFECDLSPAELKKLLRRQLLFNKIFHSKFIYEITHLLNKIGLFKKQDLGFFYANLKYEKALCEKTEKENFDNLFEIAFSKVLGIIEKLA